MKERIAWEELHKKVKTPKEAAAIIQDGMTVAVGGYTSSGYPKEIAKALVERKKAGEPFKIRLLSGANDGPLDTILAEEEIISWRAPMIESKVLAKQVNQGLVTYVEQQMNKMPRLTASGAFGKIDVAVIEALKITKEGYIVPTSSVGMIPYFLELAEKVIVEINIAQPMALEGMHDVYLPEKNGKKQPIPLLDVTQRIGKPFLELDLEKIEAIVFSNEPDKTTALGESKEQTIKIAENLIAFLKEEIKHFPNQKLPPIQTGFGNLASEIVKGLSQSSIPDITFFCGGLQEANVELLATGNGAAASTGSIQMTPRVMELFETHKEVLREKIIIRNTDITNNGEVIGRMGLIALTSGVEVDMYGNVNSSHVGGTKVVNGLGGGANFAQNAGLSIVLIPAENKNGDISAIVPMVSHQDISEHDVDIIITEYGIADLRGKADVERAALIIKNCASRTYQEMLTAYLNRAIKEVGGHHPQILEEAFNWHVRLQKTGSMKE